MKSDNYHHSSVLSKDPQFVKADGNSVTFPMQAFDSLLPFGAQYTLCFLKQKKPKSF